MWMCPWFLYNLGLCAGCCSGQPVCALPADSGPCNVQYDLRWYYDPLSGQCRQFMYGGCEGNGNNFLLKSECIQTCNALPTDSEFCKLPKDRGPCSAHFEKWYYEPIEGKCHPFVYGGCDGNDNRFDSEENCLSICTRSYSEELVDNQLASAKSIGGCNPFRDSPDACTNIIRESPERCLHPLRQGPCDGALPRWYFDPTIRDCLPFAYGGCHGNRNRFLTKEICVTECHSKMTSSATVSQSPPVGARFSLYKAVTKRQPRSGMMTTSRLLYLNDVMRKFLSHQNKPIRDVQATDMHGDFEHDMSNGLAEEFSNLADGNVCQLPKDAGPCTEYVPYWYFDQHTASCRKFRYGGCQGNGNRFKSQEECQNRCQEQQDEVHAMIALKKGAIFHGQIPSTDGSQPRFPQQTLTGSTDPITSGTTHRAAPSKKRKPEMKNKNQGREEGKRMKKKFPPAGDLETEQMTEEGKWQRDESAKFEINQVHQRTKEKSAEQKITIDEDRCHQPENRGRLCEKWGLYWLYDDQTSLCRRFHYGGCDGNGNRFKTEEECVLACLGSYQREE